MKATVLLELNLAAFGYFETTTDEAYELTTRVLRDGIASCGIGAVTIWQIDCQLDDASSALARTREVFRIEINHDQAQADVASVLARVASWQHTVRTLETERGPQDV